MNFLKPDLDTVNVIYELTCVGICERCHKLQVFLHQCGLVDHSGARSGHKGHGGGWDRLSCKGGNRDRCQFDIMNTAQMRGNNRL